jgi:c-di-GMP-binding flagellar brake protein YcgR
MLAYEDNRNFYRMLINAECTIHVQDENFTGICKDLSATGMSFALKQKSFPVGTMLHIEIDSQNREIPSFSAEAEVIRDAVARGEDYVIGVKFHKMN